MASYGEGRYAGPRYPVTETRPFAPHHQKQNAYMGPMHGPSLGPRPMALQSGGLCRPPSEGSMYPSHQYPDGGQMYYRGTSRYPGPDIPPQHSSCPPGQPPHMWSGISNHFQPRQSGPMMMVQQHKQRHPFNPGVIHPLPPNSWPDQPVDCTPHNDQNKMSAVTGAPPINQRPMMLQNSKPHLASMLESPEMLALQQLSASSRACSGQPVSTFPVPPQGSGHPFTSHKTPPDVQRLCPVTDSHSMHSREMDLTPSKKLSTKQESATPSISLSCSNAPVRSPLKTESAKSDEKSSDQESDLEKGSHAPDVDVCKQESIHSVPQDYDQVSEICPRQMELDKPIPQTPLQQNSQIAAHHNSSLQTSDGPLYSTHNAPRRRSEKDIHPGLKSHIQNNQSHLKSEPPDALKAISFSSLLASSPVSQTDAQSTTVDHGDRTHSEPQNYKVSGENLESQDTSNSDMIRSAPSNGHLDQSLKEKSVKVEAPSLGGFQVGGAPHKQVLPPFLHGQNAATAHYNQNAQTNQLYMQHIGRSVQSANGQAQVRSIPQNINIHPSAARYPSYQHHGSYSYHMAGKPPEGPSNVFPHHQQQHYYPRAQGSRGFLSEEWHRTPFSGPSSACPSASVNGPLKGSSISPMSSDGPASPPNPLSNQPHSGPVEAKEAVGPVKAAHLEDGFDRSESPKEILDLDSHRLAAHGGPPYPQPSANILYNTQRVQSGMQQDGRGHPLHMMNSVTFPNQNYVRRHYSPQQPHSHLMEALQRPQRLPFQPGQTHVAVSRRPQLVPHFQGRMPSHSGLPPEHFFHPR